MHLYIIIDLRHVVCQWLIQGRKWGNLPSPLKKQFWSLIKKICCFPLIIMFYSNRIYIYFFLGNKKFHPFIIISLWICCCKVCAFSFSLNTYIVRIILYEYYIIRRSIGIPYFRYCCFFVCFITLLLFVCAC